MQVIAQRRFEDRAKAEGWAAEQVLANFPNVLAVVEARTSDYIVFIEQP